MDYMNENDYDSSDYTDEQESKPIIEEGVFRLEKPEGENEILTVAAASCFKAIKWTGANLKIAEKFLIGSLLSIKGDDEEIIDVFTSPKAKHLYVMYGYHDVKCLAKIDRWIIKDAKNHVYSNGAGSFGYPDDEFRKEFPMLTRLER